MMIVPISNLTLLILTSSTYPRLVTIYEIHVVNTNISSANQWSYISKERIMQLRLWDSDLFTSVTDSSSMCLMEWWSKRFAFFGFLVEEGVLVAIAPLVSAVLLASGPVWKWWRRKTQRVWDRRAECLELPFALFHFYFFRSFFPFLNGCYVHQTPLFSAIPSVGLM